jgi:kynureninase
MAPLVGAAPLEVVATGSTTVNLHQLVATFYHPCGQRREILTDALTFPSDLYALASELRLRGQDPAEHLVKICSGDGGWTLDEEDIVAAMTPEVALVVLPSVLYVSGQLLDLKYLTEQAHRRHIPIGFDLAHSVGILPHHLDSWDVDFAFWCTYKYLNGGPGSVAGLFVNTRHFGKRPGLAGWFGSDKLRQFDMEQDLTPACTAGAYQIGTPHILSLAPLLGSLEMFEEIGIVPVREKSLALTRYLMDLAAHRLCGYGFSVVTPKEDARRRGHVALSHPEAVRICKALKARRVIPDYRPPQVIRLAPSPLYNSFEQVWRAVDHLREIMAQEEYTRFSPGREVIS